MLLITSFNLLSSSLINKNPFNSAVHKLIIKMTQSASMTLNLISSDIVQFTSCFDLKRLFPIDIFLFNILAKRFVLLVFYFQEDVQRNWFHSHWHLHFGPILFFSFLVGEVFAH